MDDRIDKIDNAQLFSQVLIVPVYTPTRSLSSGCSTFSLTLDIVSSLYFSSLVVWVYNSLISNEFEPLLRCFIGSLYCGSFLLFWLSFSNEFV